MKKEILLLLTIFFTSLSWGQNNTALSYFNSGGAEYVNDHTDKALEIVEEGLSKYPKDEKLKKLYEKLKEKKKEEDKKNQQDKNKQDQKQDKKDQQNTQNNPQQNGKNQPQNQPGQDQKDKQQQQQQQGQMSNEEAQKLLDAIGSEETKVQQKLTKDKNKPQSGKVQKDW